MQVFKDQVVHCYMNMIMPERISEFVVKQNENGITVFENLYDQKNSVIPAIASEEYGNPELYYAKENPEVGMEVLKKGMLIAKNKDAVGEDMDYIYEEIKTQLKKSSEQT